MLANERAAVRVPATSANLGPGFDVLGLSLKYFDELSVEVSDGPDQVNVIGEGETELPTDDKHLVIRSMRAAFDFAGLKVPGLKLTCKNQIPHARGMGSSSAAIVGGIALARELMGAERLSIADFINLAGRLEGHPDNIAPCILGGMTIAWIDNEGHHAVKLDVHPDIVPVVSIPDFKVPTETARGLLPLRIAHDDAVFNLSRSSLMVYAMTKDPDLLFTATEDRMHQRQRADVMPQTLRAITELRSVGLPAVISGAGPTVLTLAAAGSASQVSEVLQRAGLGFKTITLGVEPDGVQALPIN
ncbi:MAG: homoserine kinase [Candidatus Nanopelagicales bacterium]